MTAKRFVVYRPNAPEDYQPKGHANAPADPQLEGVVFSDGTVAVRWLTDYTSFSCWDSLETFLKVHGHPEYGTIIDWLDDSPDKISDGFTPALSRFRNRWLPDPKLTMTIRKDGKLPQ